MCRTYKKISQPVLNLYAEKNNQVLNAASISIKDLVGSKDFTNKCFPTGHIGMFVSGRSQKIFYLWYNKNKMSDEVPLI